MASSDPTSGDNGERDVFGSLPNSRPQRRSAKRSGAGTTAKAAAPAAPKAKAAAAAKPRPAKPKATPKPRATAKASPTATAGPGAKPSVATASPPIPAAGYATPRAEDDGVPRGAHLVTTAVQAVGELAQIGLSAGGRAVKSALGRLPRP